MEGCENAFSRNLVISICTLPFPIFKENGLSPPPHLSYTGSPYIRGLRPLPFPVLRVASSCFMCAGCRYCPQPTAHSPQPTAHRGAYVICTPGCARTCARLFRPLASRFVHFLGSHFAAASSFSFAERPPFTNPERIPPAKIRSQNTDSEFGVPAAASFFLGGEKLPYSSGRFWAKPGNHRRRSSSVSRCTRTCGPRRLVSSGGANG
jgi:hypothetical protein